MVDTKHIWGEDVLAVVCIALTNGHRSPLAQLQHVESLLGVDWDQPLYLVIPSSGSQQYKLEAHYVQEESFVTHTTTEIVENYRWLT